MSAPSDIRVYVNERGVNIPAGSVALDAVRALFPDHAAEVSAGSMHLTDSRGLPVAHDTRVTGGSIFRVVPVRTRTEDAR